MFFFDEKIQGTIHMQLGLPSQTVVVSIISRTYGYGQRNAFAETRS